MAILLCLVWPLLSWGQAGGTITTIAGNGITSSSGDGGPATNASLTPYVGIAFDPAGNLYIADYSRIRKVNADGIITTVAGTGVGGFSGDGGPATSARLNYATGIAFDSAGNLYITERVNNRIRKVNTAGIITTVAGNGVEGFSGDGGPATSASLDSPYHVAFDSAGNLYIVDTGNHRIRKVSPAGIITTVAGDGVDRFSGDGGPATSASLDLPYYVALDSAGNLYISDIGNKRVRKVDPNGIITTVAGNGLSGTSGDSGPATSAPVNGPFGLAFDSAGNLYIAEGAPSGCVRKVTPAGIITTVAGNGVFGFSGDGGPPTSASFAYPSGLAFNSAGNLYIVDTENRRIRKLVFAATTSQQLAVSPRSLSFTDSNSQLSQLVTVSNAGSSTMNWTAAVTSGSWLSVNPSSGTNTGTITVTVNAAGLASGGHYGVIQVASSQASNSPQTIYVRLTKQPTSTIVLTPARLRFTSASGTAASQTFEIRNSGDAFLEWTAAAATQSGGNWLAVSPASGGSPVASCDSCTNPRLTVTATPGGLPAGLYTGTITITAKASSNATNSPQTVQVELAANAPVIGNNGVVNGASFARDAVLSPGSLASLFGTNLSTTTGAATSVPLPTTLAGTQVFVNGTAAPLFYVSTGQINFQMPFGLTGTSANVAVMSGTIRGPENAVTLASETPGIFTATPGGSGPGAVLNQDFSANAAANPAAAGSVIQVFATGLGATDPVAQTGGPGATSEPFNRTAKTPVVLIGGQPAEVLFSALAPGFVSLYQVNARIPAGLAPGTAVTLQIQIGGRSSNIVTIAVRAPG